MMQQVGIAQTLEAASKLADQFESLTAHLPRERKGVRQSEMFFLYASVTHLEPRRILESGRARGQSTLILAHCFPNARILSIEFDESSEDVAVAEKRLKPFSNVELRYGDSRVLLPELLEPGDIVLIDGPKGFRALKLAAKLLNTGAPPAVFIHDLWFGSPERRCLDRCFPRSFCSDDPGFLTRYSYLDSVPKPGAPADRTGASGKPVKKGDFATFACIPNTGDFHYRSLVARITAARIFNRGLEYLPDGIKRRASAPSEE